MTNAARREHVERAATHGSLLWKDVVPSTWIINPSNCHSGTSHCFSSRFRPILFPLLLLSPRPTRTNGIEVDERRKTNGRASFDWLRESRGRSQGQGCQGRVPCILPTHSVDRCRIVYLISTAINQKASEPPRSRRCGLLTSYGRVVVFLLLRQSGS